MGRLPTPLFNSVACTLGRYCSLEIASKTLALLSLDTLLQPFTTRDTVVVETPASLATSLTVLDIAFRSVDAFTTTSLSSMAVLIPDPPSCFDARMHPPNPVAAISQK
jgi:hypothetical protein